MVFNKCFGEAGGDWIGRTMRRGMMSQDERRDRLPRPKATHMPTSEEHPVIPPALPEAKTLVIILTETERRLMA